MSRINLLPWREARRKELLTQFIVSVVVVAALAGAVWGGVHYYYVQLIDFQNQRLTFLDDKIKVLDKKIAEIKELSKQKERLLSRMRAIEQLQSNRPLIVRLFDEIIYAMPEGMTLTEVKQKGKDITISGLAQSNARVSSFMRSIENSEWIKNPNLKVIRESGTKETPNPINSFELTFKQVVPTADGEES
ncbi:MAG: PilN domain-containing protein [Gammaproteobacteria bacterium]